MDLQFGERYERFRDEVRRFLETHRPDPSLTGYSWGRRDEMVRWLTLLIEHGYWARTIPERYGGFGAAPDLLETLIMDEEFNRAGAPRGVMAQGPSMLVPTLLEHGSEEQKQRWIAPTMRGEVLWCQGYSEPGAGSDLASLRTAAREDGDDFLIDGHKIWTSTAGKADMMFALVRTEPDAPKHEGISYVLIPMTTPGLEVQPLRTMKDLEGEHSFYQVFFKDVRVPQANVVGRRGDGWRIANTTLQHERNSLNANPESIYLRLVRLMEAETANGAPALADPVLRERLMRLQARTLAMKLHGMRTLTCALRGEPAGVAGLVSKLENCQLHYDLAALALDVLGELGGLYGGAKYEREGGFWQAHAMYSLGLIIGGGTAQIQKNIIAERGLALPREPKPARSA